ncbi:tail fiber assembly protein [Pragia fontium]|uniref:Virus tail fibre assembly protein, lambda gpK n=1 Tax=Pragia fontium DSM 5563 = ATCC 49100 TaxID=1122977 RepID=A0AAJ4W9H7_9GAMM|nr:tail fiber assembly protein [Pragia fontium]SFC50162.1 virus tail fibre assembly protein, lambda gpK [Pragia fontium DSM 5563 = ATCC 49100]
MNIYREYQPERPPVQGAMYLIDSNGLDWYDAQKQFKDDTLKLMIDENRIIRSYNADVSTLFPANCAVVEIPLENVPEDLENNGMWMVTAKNKIVKRVQSKEELIEIADIEKSQRLSVAKEAIEPLSDAVEFEIATDEERATLKAWKKYRIALTRIDTSTAPNITWPEVP